MFGELFEVDISRKNGRFGHFWSKKVGFWSFLVTKSGQKNLRKNGHFWAKKAYFGCF